jgi:hypothetical protein
MQTILLAIAELVLIGPGELRDRPEQCVYRSAEKIG